MFALRRIVVLGSTAAMAVTGTSLVTGAGAARAATAPTSAALTMSWTNPTGTEVNDHVRPHLVSRTITKTDVGATIQMRVTPDSTSTIDCATEKLSYVVGGKSVALERDWYASGCWNGGANLVAKVTSAMVGGTVVLDGGNQPNLASPAYNLTGQVTIGSQVQTAKATLKRPANAPTKLAPVPAATTAPKTTTTTPTTPAPSTTPVVVNKTDGSSFAKLPRVAWEGGAAYYAKFPDAVKAGWTNPNHFPIGLWWGQVSSNDEVAYDKSKGINTYVVTNPNTDYKLFDNNNVSYIGTALQNQPRTSKSWVGDFMDDEVDGRYSATAGQDYLDTLSKKLPDHNKLRYGNYTGMVISWQDNNASWATASQNYVNKYNDATSIDAYWFSSAQCDWANPNGGAYITTFTKSNCRTAQNYGRTVTSLRAQDAKDGKLQPIWNYIEDVDVAADGKQVHALTPVEVKGAAMSSIIHEARGLMWFNNSFGGPCASGNAIRDTQKKAGYACASTVNAMGEVNNLIQSLAPVLNTQSYVWNFGTGTETMLKQYNGASYVFAMPTDTGTNSGAGKKTFTVPAALKGKKVTVVGENRTIALSGTTFTDSFANVNSYHVYKIA